MSVATANPSSFLACSSFTLKPFCLASATAIAGKLPWVENREIADRLDAFAALRRDMPDLRLLVGNPGYKPGARGACAGVEFLGALPQRQVHRQVRGALCTFVPNFVIPETFGLVFAESHALGTPVLTHDCGAAREVVRDSAQLLPLPSGARLYEALAAPLPRRWRMYPARLAAAAGLFDGYRARIRAWREGGRPQVAPDPRFRLSQVTAQWRALLSL